MDNKQNELIKGIILLFIIITGFTFAIRSFSKGENLYDYAEKNNIPIHSEIIENEEVDNEKPSE